MTATTMSKIIAAGALAASIAGPAQAQAQTQTQPTQFVDALNGVFGDHKVRASHAKGVCAVGDFMPNGNAAAITIAPHLQRAPSAVLARFSVGGGNPKASDKAKSVRGLALRFEYAPGQSTDLVMMSAPVFFVSKAENFIPFMEARRADPATGKPDPARVKAYNDSHPDSKPQIEYLDKAPIPASYGSTAYWALNAFKFTNARGKTVYGRWRVEPVAGRVGLTEDQIKTLPDDFLRGELETRFGAGHVDFDLWIQVAKPGDVVDDPTVQWPADRQEVNVGRLSLAKFSADACDSVMFNPVGLPKGIAPSEDSTLLVRLPVYGVSLGRRLNK